jgi:uncharacterized protein
MSFAEIRRALETASRLPEEELRASLSHTDELTPLVVELIGKLKAGVYLLPDQEWLLIYGIHVLAAARESALWPAWCDLLRLPDATERLFGDYTPTVVCRVTLSIVGDDSETIFDLVESEAVDEYSRWSLFQVLARMTWDGRAHIDRTRAFLTRFEREERAAADDAAWRGWLDAVVLLGLVELKPEIERVLERRVVLFNEADRTDTFERLEAAAADFAAPERFVADEIVPIDDPVEGLRWLESTTAFETPPPDPDEPPDPAASICLTEEQEVWLRGFLDSAQVPETTMSIEALDGFFSGLAAGPQPVPSAEYLPHIWSDSATRAKPDYDSAAQQEYVEHLLTRYADTIARRMAGNVAVEPFLFDDYADDIARDWASGFMLALSLRRRAWAPLMRHRSAGRLIASIAALFQDDPEEALTPDLREALVETLPEIVLAIANFWRDGAHGLAQPVRAQKIGRNDPCPCGSGKKYKKCCGAGGAPP